MSDRTREFAPCPVVGCYVQGSDSHRDSSAGSTSWSSSSVVYIEIQCDPMTWSNTTGVRRG